MKLTLAPDTTSKIVRIFVQNSSVTTGAGLTGLAHNTGSLTAYYIREGAASPTQITLVTATVGTWTSGGFKEIDATNMPGWYELHLPNALLAAGAGSVGVHLRGATNMVPAPIEIQLANWEGESGPSEQDVWEYAGGRTVDLTGVTDLMGTPADTDIATDIANLPTAAVNAAALLAATVTIGAPADGSAPNVGQALSLIMGAMGVFKLTRSSTTLTAYANDETTVLATWTLDSATDPTSRTRAS